MTLFGQKCPCYWQKSLFQGWMTPHPLTKVLEGVSPQNPPSEPPLIIFYMLLFRTNVKYFVKITKPYNLGRKNRSKALIRLTLSRYIDLRICLASYEPCYWLFILTLISWKEERRQISETDFRIMSSSPL